MGEYLPFVTIDMWTMIFTLINFAILFLLLKRFLFKPVNKLLSERAEEIALSYQKAENAENKALEIKKEYEAKLGSARSEADEIIRSAIETAFVHSDGIIKDANAQAQIIIEKTHRQVEHEKTAAMNEAKKNIASMAVSATEKLIKKSLGTETDERLIADVIDRI